MAMNEESLDRQDPAGNYSEEVAALMQLCHGLPDGVVPPGAGLSEAAAMLIEYLGREKSQLERRYRLRTQQAQELLVEKILRGNFKQAAEVENMLHMMELQLEGDWLVPVLVQTRDASSLFIDGQQHLRDNGHVPLIVSSVFTELLSARGLCSPARVDDKYAFLLNPTGIVDDEATLLTDVAAICQDAIHFIGNNFGLELRALVGEPIQGLQNVHLSFRQILDMSDYANNPENEADVLTANAMPKKEEMVPLHQDTTLEKQYLNAVVTFDFDTACNLTLEKLETLHARYGAGSVNRLKPIIGARLNTTSNILAISFEDLVDANGVTAATLFSNIFASEDYEAICQGVRHIFRLLDTHFNASRTDVSGTAGKVINFVYRNYADPDLSVENICDSLGKSRSYMSRMFKENTGMNLLDFLHTTRLTEAKKLLTDTEQGISDIARQVGYYSGWTLARVFKRYEGITPTAYRKAYKDGV
jgi:AraC-like DNA-binding protein